MSKKPVKELFLLMAIADRLVEHFERSGHPVCPVCGWADGYGDAHDRECPFQQYLEWLEG